MRVAIFDFDGTLFPHETIPFLIKQFTKLGYSRIRRMKMMAKLIPTFIEYKVFKSLDKEAFRTKAVYNFLSMFEGMTKEEVNEFFDRNVDTVLSLLDKEVIAELEAKKAEGYSIVVLSGCFDMLLYPLARKLNADEMIGTELAFSKFKDDKLRMKSSVPITIISGDNKLKATREIGKGVEIDWAASIAYADSYYDAPVLELVGHKVAVNPDPKLSEIAKEKNWLIMKTKEGQKKKNYSD